MRHIIRANPDYYRNMLTPVQFAAIVDWRALERGQFSKALGKRGAPSALARRIQQLRALELYNDSPSHQVPLPSQIPPPPPPLASPPAPSPAPPTSPPQLDPPTMTELLMAESSVEVEEIEAPMQVQVPNMQVQAQLQVHVPTIEPIITASSSGTNSSMAATAAAAATSYIQKVGAAASQFMLTMSSATTDFVQQTATSTSAAPAQCPICFDTVKDPYMGRCSHVYCKACLLNPQMRTEEISEYGNIEALRVRKCPQCRRENVSFYKVL